jgi:hypothetical protein
LKKYKRENNFTRIADQAYPVILDMQNLSDKTISEIAIDLLLKVGEGTNDT